MTESLSLPSYASMQTMLENTGLAPAECHGLLTGILSVNPYTPFAQEHILTLLPDTAPGSDELTVLNELIQTLCSVILQQLADPEFSFRLLLPSETEAIIVRAKALGMWTEAFISGLGQAGLDMTSANENEIGEMLRDLSAIAQINAIDVVDTEEHEAAMVDLEEYLRMAALTIYTETLLKQSVQSTPLIQ